MPVLCPRFTNKTTYSVSRETVYSTRMLVHICAFAYKQILAPNSKKPVALCPQGYSIFGVLLPYSPRFNIFFPLETNFCQIMRIQIYPVRSRINNGLCFFYEDAILKIYGNTTNFTPLYWKRQRKRSFIYEQLTCYFH